MHIKSTRRGQTQQNQNTVIKNGHSRELLSGISTAFNNTKEGDPRLQPSGMTPHLIPLIRATPTFPLMGKETLALKGEGGTPCRVRGFTLIELLVVVLIIGILAAVALPQYNKAVKKAHGTEVLATFDALDKALTSYYLENGTYDVTSLDELNLDIPAATHFKFVTGIFPYTTTPSDLSASFSLTALQTNRGRKEVWMVSPEGVLVVGEWSGGKLRSLWCNPAGFTSCAEYFNCQADPIRQVGTSLLGGYCSHLK